MSLGARSIPDDGYPWYLPVARAVPALALAAVVTFSADHSARLGLVALGSYAVVTGLIIMVVALRTAGGGVLRGILATQGAVSIATGVAALAVMGGGLAYLVFLVSAFGAITGFLELYLGLRSRGRDRSSRDWLFVGAATAVLAVVALAVPPDFSQPFTGPDGVARELTASVIVVGTLGAYWAIIGVYLVIAGLSLKWPTDSPATPSTTAEA